MGEAAGVYLRRCVGGGANEWGEWGQTGRMNGANGVRLGE